MAISTKIEWCDHTSSPWHGCSEIHAGCDNCYARAMSKRNPATLGVWGPNGTRVMSAGFHDNCRRWNKSAAKAGHIETVFPSICDPFEDWSGDILNSKGERLWQARGESFDPFPERPQYNFAGSRPIAMSDLRRDLFTTIDACQNLFFLLLTKRPENVLKMWPETKGPPQKMVDEVYEGKVVTCHPCYRPNVAILASISDQDTADAMIPPLLECRDLVPVFGVSAEPLLGPVDLSRWINCGCEEMWPGHGHHPECPTLVDWWSIIGGESGHGARPCNIEWIRSLIGQCKDAGVSCFVKQLGSKVAIRNDSYSEWPKSGDDLVLVQEATPRWQGEIDIVNLPDGKGGNIDEWPIDLRVREYPKAIQRA